MALENTQIQDKLTATFGESVVNFRQEKDIFTFEVTADEMTSVILFLKNEESLNFHFLTDLCGIHYPDNNVNEQFAVVYHLHNWIENKRIRIKSFINGETPEIKTISNIFLCANWMERETYDFYGINFIGHPQLKRILNMDEMVSFPMRKEFPMEDSGRTDKDDRFFGRTTNNG
ncbi:NADH-quinone oxidoreductase subunit C [Flavobacterium psychrophilum]|jgi:NADH-quinone oxidoreductase subunit C|uniref:NADH-quinone oxidoreductase subunit C n=1 Tax=Flavobacterium psychrophilum TaxID=96345 RepID=A0A8G2FZL4_FLAPS|nr:NADH-quinone oxidoreductase subunit C [Flavobacterium psychrophilum]AIN74821.1 NADH dehydrogenase [Flavobacterium psychrophilum FPG3]EKT2068872.1 NADH-quinone oxidoreductase subunit C [Flavobacterium psychrophilum]EKT2070824.1 NADH-quinone oxidoreductase subunit C [Flavobacterium psychrophilum]EKT3957643.1 NADH-quinone oxidoreductase subunit C [Flavobacterium psychrophilum]EKT3963586.1 NADH-quinone oxidoreductase subunit C [Flavobacterium psychrophilum]